MPDPVSAAVVGGSALAGSFMQSNAAKQASRVQGKAASAGIAEQRRQFDLVQALMRPYVEAGKPALAQQQDILGLNGSANQQAVINAIQNNPQFQTMTQQGENAILQNASATGGLRGGNTQGALAQFRPQMLSQLLQQQYQNLGGITSLGQNAAAGVGNAGMQTGQDIAGLLAQKGAAQAGGILGQMQPFANLMNMPAQMIGMQYGAGVKSPNLFG